MANFSTWDRVVLEEFAHDCYEELLATKADLRTAIDAYRALLKETHDTPHLQQLPTEQVQPDGREHFDVERYTLPMDLSDLQR